MNYETTDDCICGGTASLPCPNSAPDDLLACVPCHECLARWDRTHCSRCEKRFADGEGRCRFAGMHGEVFFCEACETLRPRTDADYRAMVMRRREALAAEKQAREDLVNCPSHLCAEYKPLLKRWRAAAAESRAARIAIDGQP